MRLRLDRSLAAAPADAGGVEAGAIRVKAGAIRITRVRVRRGRLHVGGIALPSLDRPARVRVRVGRSAGWRCRPLAGGSRRACRAIRARAATGVRSWKLSLRYGRGRSRRLYVAATIRQPGAPDATAVRRGRPR